MTRRPLRVAVADDHELFRTGLVALLRPFAAVDVVGQAVDSASAIDLVERTAPDTLLLDVEMPGPGAAATISRIRRLRPDTRIIALSMHRGRALEDALVRSGASVLVSKTVGVADLVAVLLDSGPSAPVVPTAGPLTRRELEVLHRLSSPGSIREIAAELGIAPGTVKRHVHEAYRKLGSRSRLEAVQKARLLGLLEPGP